MLKENSPSLVPLLDRQPHPLLFDGCESLKIYGPLAFVRQSELVHRMKVLKINSSSLEPLLGRK